MEFNSLNSFNKYVLRLDIMLGIVLGAGDAAANIRKSIPEEDGISACVLGRG